MNDESVTADKQALLKAIELWLKQKQQKSNAEKGG